MGRDAAAMAHSSLSASSGRRKLGIHPVIAASTSNEPLPCILAVVLCKFNIMHTRTVLSSCMAIGDDCDGCARAMQTRHLGECSLRPPHTGPLCTNGLPTNNAHKLHHQKPALYPPAVPVRGPYDCSWRACHLSSRDGLHLVLPRYLLLHKPPCMHGAPHLYAVPR